MIVQWTNEAWVDYLRWRATDQKVFKRLNRIVEAVADDPFRGIGKPEPLRHELSGYWSRRITGEHRLVYRVQAGRVHVISCRYHYKK